MIWLCSLPKKLFLLRQYFPCIVSTHLQCLKCLNDLVPVLNSFNIFYDFFEDLFLYCLPPHVQLFYQHSVKVIFDISQEYFQESFFFLESSIPNRVQYVMVNKVVQIADFHCIILITKCVHQGIPLPKPPLQFLWINVCGLFDWFPRLFLMGHVVPNKLPLNHQHSLSLLHHGLVCHETHLHCMQDLERMPCFSILFKFRF